MGIPRPKPKINISQSLLRAIFSFRFKNKTWKHAVQLDFDVSMIRDLSLQQLQL